MLKLFSKLVDVSSANFGRSGSEYKSLIIARRQRHYWKNMGGILEPPDVVRGMQELQREAFRKCVQVPTLRVSEDQINAVLPLVKKLLLKMEHLRPVRILEQTVQRDELKNGSYKEILLHPTPVQNWESLPTMELQKLQIAKSQFQYEQLDLNYENWRADEILKSVLPTEEEGMTSFSRIGHVVHLNLRDHLMPYKKLIGEVLRDKVPGCRTVVNKADPIDNTYRNFQLELICGEPHYQVETKENGIPFEFDFSRVYWNPRLSTEHERIVKMLQAGDVLYDVFAGVGPFSVPAAKKRCDVLANDLNPESFRWLQHNAKRNKCLKQAQLFNKDGHAFILEDVKTDLLKRWTAQSFDMPPNYSMHITMNLPAMAVEFLEVFRGLFEEHADTLLFDSPNFNFPIVHVYSFAKGEDTKTIAHALVEQHLGLRLADNLQDIHFVRRVAPNKDMYRISFRLTKQILCTSIKSLKVENDVATRKRVALNESKDELPTQASKMKCN